MKKFLLRLIASFLASVLLVDPASAAPFALGLAMRSNSGGFDLSCDVCFALEAVNPELVTAFAYPKTPTNGNGRDVWIRKVRGRLESEDVAAAQVDVAMSKVSPVWRRAGAELVFLNSEEEMLERAVLRRQLDAEFPGAISDHTNLSHVLFGFRAALEKLWLAYDLDYTSESPVLRVLDEPESADAFARYLEDVEMDRSHAIPRGVPLDDLWNADLLELSPKDVHALRERFTQLHQKRNRKVLWVLLHQLPNVKALRLYREAASTGSQTIELENATAFGIRPRQPPSPEATPWVAMDVPLDRIVGFRGLEKHSERVVPEVILAAGVYQGMQGVDLKISSIHRSFTEPRGSREGRASFESIQAAVARRLAILRQAEMKIIKRKLPSNRQVKNGIRNLLEEPVPPDLLEASRRLGAPVEMLVKHNYERRAAAKIKKRSSEKDQMPPVEPDSQRRAAAAVDENTTSPVSRLFSSVSIVFRKT